MKAHFAVDARTFINQNLAFACSSTEKQLKGNLKGLGKGDNRGNWEGKLEDYSIKSYLVIPLSISQIFVGVVTKLLEPIEKIVFAALDMIAIILCVPKVYFADVLYNVENALIDIITLPVGLALTPLSIITQIYHNANGHAGLQLAQVSMQDSLITMGSGVKPESIFQRYAKTIPKIADSNEKIHQRPLLARVCAIPVAILDVTLELVRNLVQVIEAVEVSVGELWKAIAELGAALVLFPIKAVYQIGKAIYNPQSYQSISVRKANFQDRDSVVVPLNESEDF